MKAPAVEVSPLRELYVPNSSPALLSALLEELDAVLDRAGIPHDEVFAMGLREDEIREAFQSVDLAPPEELVVWFQWQNGLRMPRPVLWPLRFVAPHSLAAAISSYSDLALAELTNHEPVKLWLPGWIFLEDHHLGLAVGPDDSEHGPPLRMVDFDEPLSQPAQGPVARSLCTLVALFLDAVDRGGYTFEEQRWVPHRERLTDLQKLSRFLSTAPSS